MALIPYIHNLTVEEINRVLRKLASSKLGPAASPVHTGLTLTGLTASRLIQSDANKKLASVANLASWIAGTANEIDITNDGDGTITIGIVNPLAVAKGGTGTAILTDHSILLGSGTGAITPLGVASNGQIPIGSTGLDPVLATLTGTSNQITVTNGAGSITLATPQDIHTGASPIFADLTLSAPSNIYALSHDSFAGFVANEHIDHTSVTLTAGVGLSGGGDISANRTFTVDLNELTTETAIAAGDFIAMVDITDSGSGKITFANFESTLNHDSLTGFVANEHIDWTIDQGATNIHSGNYDNTQLTQEQVEDYAGALIANATGTHTGITVTYQDATGDIDLVVDHDAASNFVAAEHFLQSAITTVGTIATGIWQGTSISTTYTDAKCTVANADNTAANETSHADVLQDGDFVSNGLMERTGAGIYGIKVIGTDIQAYGAILDDLNTLGAPTLDGQFIVATGAGVFAYESGATARTSIGLENVENTALSTWTGSTNITTLGTIATVGNITITNGGTIGQAAGPLLTFNDTTNYLRLSGAYFAIDGNNKRIYLGTSGWFVFNRGDATTDIYFGESTDTGNYIFRNKRNFTIGDSAVTNSKLAVDGSVSLKERATANADTAAYGQIWVKTATPNELWFTDDAGTDHQIAFV